MKGNSKNDLSGLEMALGNLSPRRERDYRPQYERGTAGYQTESWRRVAARRTAAGLCIRCGKQPPRENRQQCQDCADHLARNAAARKAKYEAEGLCRACGQPNPDSDKTKKCRRCKDYQIARYHRLGRQG